ncbi:hypothetical protein C8R45DRAFT_987642 [Mycena sanguinolenta]|nr:hypothetical protein C8R45DRAFT_987642 [Mycena sanguinolenta]
MYRSLSPHARVRRAGRPHLAIVSLPCSTLRTRTRGKCLHVADASTPSTTRSSPSPSTECISCTCMGRAAQPLCPPNQYSHRTTRARDVETIKEKEGVASAWVPHTRRAGAGRDEAAVHRACGLRKLVIVPQSHSRHGRHHSSRGTVRATGTGQRLREVDDRTARRTGARTAQRWNTLRGEERFHICSGAPHSAKPT